MNCSDLITKFLNGYLDGSLPAGTLADFEHHLDVCPSCVAYLQTYRETIAMTAAAGRAQRPGDVPEELVRAILASVK
jgi:anti-sigma factor RsiW